MNLPYLAIENDIGFHERASKFWESRNISSVRVTSIPLPLINDMCHKRLL